MESPSGRYGPLVHRSVHRAAVLWIVGAVQFVLAQVAVQLAWDAHLGNPNYSLAHNYISDLGAVGCGQVMGRFVCSPWHDVFNGSIIVLGILLILGVLWIPTAFPTRPIRRIALGLLVVAGIGAIGVGLAPENVALTAHLVSALLAFVGANLALVVLGFAMFRDTRWDGYRAYTVLSGLVGLVAVGLLAAHAYDWGGLWSAFGAGGMERLTLAPALLWTILVSFHLLQIRSYAPARV